jgi:hypothetical protein
MNRAKAAARAAGAAAPRSAPFREAAAVERSAIRMFDAGQLAEATPRFYEAAGLYRSAEVSATTARSAPEPPRSVPPPAASKSTEPAPTPSPTPAPPSQPPVQTGPLPDPPAQQPAGPAPGSAAPLPVPPVTRPDAAPAAPSAKSAEPPAAAAAEEGVRDLVRRYEQALESRSIEALKTLWPSLSGAQEDAVRNEFLHARRIEVDVTIGDVSVAGATATVTFLRRYRLSTVDGQQLLRNSRTTLSARRAGSDWVIDRMRFEAIQ